MIGMLLERGLVSGRIQSRTERDFVESVCAEEEMGDNHWATFTSDDHPSLGWIAENACKIICEKEKSLDIVQKQLQEQLEQFEKPRTSGERSNWRVYENK